MTLGLSLGAFTLLHVAISLIAIVAGVIVMFAMFRGDRMPGLTAIFLLFTILTSVTGFMFPFTELLPSHVLGIISLVLLAIACVALYGLKMAGIWRSIYVVTALTSLYLNVFVLVVQTFLKINTLHELAPGNPPSGLSFAAVQGIVLLFFLVMIVFDLRRYRPGQAAA
ncbi:MAG: hypothetical protein JOY90_09720 [Bradyrhizobium sp.]|uniref:hypothetical protein n=1 Tax=Bradyrhizobium sp. TaxID=376 RepID=UPI001E063405|nr:hypothetical protein [Bradyrhizobium sp.]MBV9560721.1 hypothetical protein [Bradyrhizobium sp.]